MASDYAAQTKAYHQKRDPHYGNKINSIEDFQLKAVELLQTHPEGMTVRRLISELIPYEGQYHIPLPSYVGRLISNVKGTFKDGDKWKYSEN